MRIAGHPDHERPDSITIMSLVFFHPWGCAAVVLMTGKWKLNSSVKWLGTK